MNEEMTTIQDECILMGGPRVILKNGGDMLNIMQQIVTNYYSSDFDHVAFLADIQLAKDNCSDVIEAAQLTVQTLNKLRNEVTIKTEK